MLHCGTSAAQLLPSPPAGQGRPVTAIYTARLLGQGCASPARTLRPGGQAVTAPCCLGSPSSARSRPAAFGAPGGLSGGRHIVVTLCGTGATLGNPLRQLAALVKVQGPAQLFSPGGSAETGSLQLRVAAPGRRLGHSESHLGGVFGSLSPVRRAACSVLLPSVVEASSR